MATKYETGSKEEGLAGSILQSYYSAGKEPTIRLTNPKQVQLLDAMAEAAGVPHQRGQTEITIPEKLRNYNQYLISPEYEERWSRAQSRRNSQKRQRDIENRPIRTSANPMIIQRLSMVRVR